MNWAKTLAIHQQLCTLHKAIMKELDEGITPIKMLELHDTLLEAMWREDRIEALQERNAELLVHLKNVIDETRGFCYEVSYHNSEINTQIEQLEQFLDDMS